MSSDTRQPAYTSTLGDVRDTMRTDGHLEVGVRNLLAQRKDWRHNPLPGFAMKLGKNRKGVPQLKVWECYVPGPSGTYWAGGLYKVRFEFPDTYPLRPPKCRFEPTVFHPNVGSGGLVCMGWSRKGGWKTGTTVKKILEQIQFLLGEPNWNSFLNTEAFKLAHNNPEAFGRRVRREALKNDEEAVRRELAHSKK